MEKNLFISSFFHLTFFRLNCIASVHLIVPGITLQCVSHGIFSILRTGISGKFLNLVFESRGLTYGVCAVLQAEPKQDEK